MTNVNRRVLPGFYSSLGFTLFYLTLLVLIPLAACLFKAATLTPGQFWAAVWTERARAAYLLTFGTSLASAAANVILGVVIAWVLVRYEFPLKRLLDSLIDLPFALPTAVAGLVYSNLYVKSGWLGPIPCSAGHRRQPIRGWRSSGADLYRPAVCRPGRAAGSGSLDVEFEEAAAILGATRWQTFRRVILPTVSPALVTGFVLAFARALGEYGSVVFVSGNMPFKTEIAPVLIVARLEEFKYAEATAIAVVLLVVSFALLGAINLLESWSKQTCSLKEKSPASRKRRCRAQKTIWAVRWGLTLTAIALIGVLIIVRS